MKKLLSLILASLLILSIFAGCKTKNETVNITEDDESKEVKLTWYVLGTEVPDYKMVNEKFNEILKKKINATLDLKFVDGGNYDQKMKIMTAASDEFDLCFTTGGWKNDYYKNVAQGVFVPLNEMMDKYAPKLKANIPAKFWNAIKVNSEVYGVINYQISATQVGMAFWNTELIKKYNLEEQINNLKEFKDLEPIYKVIKENEPTVKLAGWIPDFTEDKSKHYEKLIQLPLIIYNDDDSVQVKNMYEEEHIVENIKLRHDWFKKGYIPSDILTMKDNSALQKSGKLFSEYATMKPGGEMEAESKLGRDVILKPLLPAITYTNSIMGTMTAISKTSKNPIRAMKFLELINTDKELYNLLCYGIEGKHYTKIDDNTIEKIKDNNYSINSNWMFGNTFNAYLLKGAPKTLNEDTIKVNEEAIPSNILGFNFDMENFTSEMAQLSSVIAEMGDAIDQGVVDPAIALEPYKEKLNKAGLQKVTKELQAQIDKWKATK